MRYHELLANNLRNYSKKNNYSVRKSSYYVFGNLIIIEDYFNRKQGDRDEFFHHNQAFYLQCKYVYPGMPFS